MLRLEEARQWARGAGSGEPAACVGSCQEGVKGQRVVGEEAAWRGEGGQRDEGSGRLGSAHLGSGVGKGMGARGWVLVWVGGGERSGEGHSGRGSTAACGAGSACW